MSRTGDEFSQELKETDQPCKKKKTNNRENEGKSCEYCHSTEQLPRHLENNSDCLQLYINRHNITESNHMKIIWLVCSQIFVFAVDWKLEGNSNHTSKVVLALKYIRQNLDSFQSKKWLNALPEQKE